MERSDSDLKTLFKKVCKIAEQKKMAHILSYLGGFFWYRCISLRLTVFLPQIPKVPCPNFLDFRNPWGKVMGRSDLRL